MGGLECWNVCVWREGDGGKDRECRVRIFTLWKIFKRESTLSPAPPRPGMEEERLAPSSRWPTPW